MKLITLNQLTRQTIDQLARMSEYDRAKLRVQLRQHYKLPAVREKSLEN
jgi:hypothetical protein